MEELFHPFPHHDFDKEWVYNSTDIDDAKVVWALDTGPRETRTPISDFNDRRVWLIEPDERSRGFPSTVTSGE